MYLTQLYPAPTKITEYSDEPFRFGAKCKLTLPHGISTEIVENIRKVWHRFTFTASELEIHFVGSGCFALFSDGDIHPNAISGGDYYRISVDRKGAAVGAVSEKALVDGISMLVQLIIPESLDYGKEIFYIPPTDLSGKPSLAVRMLHLCVFPESKLTTIEKAISFAGFLGFTHIVLEFWGMLKYETNPYLSWKDAFTKEQIKPLISLAHGYGMEVIPMINHLGHATQSRVGMGRHTVLNQNQRLQMYFEPDGWTWCLSNPDTRKLLASVRDELTELCGKGSYFHLGCDEAYSFATCPKCRQQKPHELLAEYINEVTEDLASVGRRPIIWHDQLLKRSDIAPDFKEPIVAYYAGGVPAGDTTPAIDLLDRRVIIADWQYSYTTAENPSTPYFMEKGFDVLCCPWDNPHNIRGLCEAARQNHAYGVMLTTWHHLPDYISNLPRNASYVWQTGNYTASPRTETAALLRKMGDWNDFPTAGWSEHEVDG